MRPRILTVPAICLALAATACTLEGGEIAPTPVPVTTITTSAPAEEEVDLRQFQFGYTEGYLLVPVEQVEETLAILADRGVELGEADLSEILSDMEGELEETEEHAQAREALEGMVQLFTVPEGEDDSLDIAGMVREGNGELDASPVHAMGETGHVSWAPGNDALPIPGYTMPQVPTADDEIYAAVVDSGIHPDAPGLDGNVVSMPSDLEPGGGDGHSHGTFVSGIIRHLSPDHRITFARARTVDISLFTWVDDEGKQHDVTGDTRQALTSELHVAEAILRIVHRHQRDPESVHSLNLSVGAYSPLPTSDPALVSIFKALERWFEVYPDTPVFAAAGNDPVYDPEVLPFWPAALSMHLEQPIYSVAALNDPADEAIEEIVWDDQGAEVAWRSLTSTPRHWVTHSAPGSLLVNQTGVSTVAAWSGSSFATAVANGLYLRGEEPFPPRRAAIQGLMYWDGTQVLP